MLGKQRDQRDHHRRQEDLTSNLGRSGGGRDFRLAAIVLPCFWILFALVAPYQRFIAGFEDDAYYYFGVAQNLAAGRGSTFSGIDPTNGYHPLWLLCLVPAFLVSSGRWALVLVAVVSGLLCAASLLVLGRLERRLRHPGAGVIAFGPLVVCGTAGPTYWFNGMESGLLLLTVLLLSLALVRTDLLRTLPEGGKATWLLGLLLSAMVLSRLDSVFLASFVVALAVLRAQPLGVRSVARRILPLVAPLLVALALYLAINLRLFDSAIPVSGRAKGLGGPFVNVSALTQFLRAPVLAGVPLHLGLANLVLVPLSLFITRGHEGPRRSLACTATLLWSAGLATIVYYATCTSWPLWPWYFSSLPLVFGLASMALLPSLLGASLLRLGANAAGICCLGFVVLNLLRLGMTDVPRAAFVRDAAFVADELDRVLPSTSVVAMGDRAGALGFHLHRPLIHLEGLVGPAEYLMALESGQESVYSFLGQRHVDTYIKSGFFDGRALGQGRWAFTEPSQGFGPKVEIVVSERDLLFEHPLADGTMTWVWRLDVGRSR